MTDKAEIIRGNAKALRAMWPDRAERKSKVAHMRKCGGLIGMIATDLIVAAVEAHKKMQAQK